MMTNSDKEWFRLLGFNEDQLYVAEILLNGIDGVVMSSNPEHQRKIREKLGLKEDK